MSNVPDYSQYISVKKVNVAQTGNTNSAIIKSRSTYAYNNAFPLYKSIRLPVNALLSNKFIPPPIPFSPLQLSGLNFWLDAADSSTITSVGGAVSQWDDKSVNKYNVTQSDNTFKPTYSTNIMTFSSNKNFNIPNAAINNTTNYDIFLVFNPKVSSNWIFAKQYDGNYSSPALSTNIFVGYTTGTTNYVYFRSATNPYESTNINSNAAISTGDSDSTQILGVHNNSSNILFNSNGTTLNTTTALGIADSTTITNFKLGAWYANGSYTNSGVTNFDLSEMLFFNSNLSVSDRQKMEGYLAWKWSLQSKLPSDHPYKNAKPTA